MRERGRPTAGDDETTDALASLTIADRQGEEATRRPGRFAGIGAVVARNRLLWIVAVAALVSLVAGLVIGRFAVSPEDAAAGAAPPAPGLITAPVGFGALSTDVTLRGEVAFADPVEVTVDTTTIQGAAVVTGRVPAAGAELAPLSIALEVAGRPVIVLPGELPAYRTLRFGVSGPDVVQFKTAMRSIGLDAGDPTDDEFDEAAAQSVTELYAQAGYAAPAIDDGDAAVRAAEEAVASSTQALAAARKELAAAQAGPSAARAASTRRTGSRSPICRTPSPWPSSPGRSWARSPRRASSARRSTRRSRR
ncbi:hypothetical protein NB037_10095 [Rathayibacter sp. ZW T2_19]|uniref:Peptidoglycan binding domain-containing protein n=1 Tax=Rathayibacter rubneri TaxID=2950106 RepID=A0A9X2DX55_9MICO|nr:hypothetical protein [Rathayibacter rubneri]MCM6762765.1 hypothetical protein [Rathayibacter rubneri]